MARGYPDYSNSQDTWDVTVRTTTLPRVGKVYGVDNFESPLWKWEDAGDAGYTAQLTVANAYEGPSCMYLKPNAADDDEVYAFRRWPLPEENRVAIAFVFAVDGDAYGEIRLDFNYRDGTDHYTGAIQWIEGDHWQYRDNAGAWQDITGGAQEFIHDWHAFNEFVLIFDKILHQYVYLVVNHQFMDLTGIELQRPGGSSVSVLYTEIMNIADEDDNVWELWIDNFTVAEVKE